MLMRWQVFNGRVFKSPKTSFLMVFVLQVLMMLSLLLILIRMEMVFVIRMTWMMIMMVFQI